MVNVETTYHIPLLHTLALSKILWAEFYREDKKTCFEVFDVWFYFLKQPDGNLTTTTKNRPTPSVY